MLLVAVGSLASAAAAAGVDALQIVQVRPAGDSVEVLVAVPERFSGQPIPAEAFTLDAGAGPTRPISIDAIDPGRTAVGFVFDNRATVAPRELLAALAAAVELVRGVEPGTAFAVVTTAGPTVVQGPTTDRSAASLAIGSLRIGGAGSIADGVDAVLQALGRDYLTPAVAVFTARNGVDDGIALAPSVSRAGGLLTVLDATGASAADLIPAMDELAGTLTGRHLLTLPAWGPGPAMLDLTTGGRSYQATVDLPPPARPPEASASPPVTSGSLPAGETRPAESVAPAAPTSTPAPASTSDGERARFWALPAAAALALAAVGIVLLRRRQTANRPRYAGVSVLDPPDERLVERPHEPRRVHDESERDAPPEAIASTEELALTDPAPAPPLERDEQHVAPAEPAASFAPPDVWFRSGASAAAVSRSAAPPDEAPADMAPADLAPAEVAPSDMAPAEVVPPEVAPPVVEIPGVWPSPARPVRWPDFPAIDDLLAWAGRGVSTGRTWVVSPSQTVLRARWSRLLAASGDDRRRLFVEGRGARRVDAVDEEGLPGYPACGRSIASETRGGPVPLHYARRSFDRQWLLPDRRVIDRPNAALWGLRAAPDQLFLTSTGPPLAPGGPAVTATTLLPQFNHYNGQPGRVWPLWLDREGREPNCAPGLLPLLAETFGTDVTGIDLFAYLAGVTAQPAFTDWFAVELTTGALRVPVTADGQLFARAVALGHRVLWLQTLGDHRRHEPGQGRSLEPLQRDVDGYPRLAVPIPHLAASRPETVSYTASTGSLDVGNGVIADVDPQVVDYHVGGMPVVEQWLEQRVPFAPRRRQSPLDHVTAARWEAGWTGELLQVLHAITRLRGLEPAQRDLLDDVLAGPLLSTRDLLRASAQYAATGGPPGDDDDAPLPAAGPEHTARAVGAAGGRSAVTDVPPTATEMHALAE